MAGGLATTSTIVRADFWRLGQCRPGDTLRLKRVSWDSARELRQRTEAYLVAAQEFIASSGTTPIALVDINLPSDWSETILHRIETPLEVVFRQSGDSYLHVTYGPMTSSALTRAHIQYRVDQLAKDSDIVAIITATRCEYLVLTQEPKLTISIQRTVRSTRHHPVGPAQTADRFGTFARLGSTPHSQSGFQFPHTTGRSTCKGGGARLHEQSPRLGGILTRQRCVHCPSERRGQYRIRQQIHPGLPPTRH